ncbi:TPA: hypothetical protein ACN335_003771 [Vibrio parahaemolyticus]|uniref:hypothetical protein n=1 Tax=Vibrio cholerae TaxID=666 RepID=UPI001186ECC8|nr:hypothetical protein [Vibrio cholerae]MDF4915859.1 hypothetical protein [Vibrio parahaemolyticus]TVM12319.1 hypothetical protein FPV40_12565 [Vibrio cholerae]HDV5496897.1 hypothetical protein [Vibrio cholerae]
MNKEVLEVEKEELQGLIKIHQAIIEELDNNDNLVLKSAATRRKKKVVELEKELQAIEMLLVIMKEAS